VSVAATLLALAGPAGAQAMPVETESVPRAAPPAVVAVPCSLGTLCGAQAIRSIVMGSVARPAVQRPVSAPAAQQVLRPTALVPGQIRSIRR
jgi:hypothetical protein